MESNRVERPFDANLSFPGYVVGEESQPDSAMTSEADGREWFLYFHTKELAELYIEQAGIAFVTHRVDDVARLRLFLNAVPSVAGVLLDTTFKPSWFKFVERSEI